MIQGPFAKEVLGKTFTIIQGKDIKVGDVLVDFQCVNFSHQVPAEITQAKPNGDFIHLKWIGGDGKEGKQYSPNLSLQAIDEPRALVTVR